jgi:hypothetical protein
VPGCQAPHPLPTTMKHRAPYHAFLLKLWPIVSQEQILWRVVLENPYTGQRKGFRDLEAFEHFLRMLTQEDAEHANKHHQREEYG